jgi:hypothetical protein
MAADNAARLKIRPRGADVGTAVRRPSSKVIKLCPSQKHGALRAGGHLAVELLPGSVTALTDTGKLFVLRYLTGNWAPCMGSYASRPFFSGRP